MSEEKEKIPLKHFPNAQVDFTQKMPLIGGDNAFLDDIATRYVPKDLQSGRVERSVLHTILAVGNQKQNRLDFWQVLCCPSICLSLPFIAHPSLTQTYMNLHTHTHLHAYNLSLYSEDTEKTITSGFFRLKKGEPLVYHYTYHEMKIILEGSFIISDECGNKVTAKPGDTFYFKKGATITFDTPDFGLAFFCGQSMLGEG